MSDTEKPVPTELSDEEIIGKKHARQEIEDGYEAYFEAGGVITKYVAPFHKDHYYLCDGFLPNHGGIQSHAEVKDTMVRKPRPPKRFGSKR